MSVLESLTTSMMRRAVSSQAGILEGANPTTYNSSNPIILFIIQAGIIIIFCRLLHYPLSLLGQPRVIAEVIGGILLGPSVMMRIPGFKDSIFPTESMPVLNNVANLGLIIFLFLVALEVDIRIFMQNWRVAISVGAASMLLPFGLGVAIAWGLFHEFRAGTNLDDIGFGTYALFIGTALSITAFPVLCRILTELKLLHTNIGVTALAAGVSNDVTGWILLALCVALANNSSGLAALWALLCTIGWTLFLVFFVRPIFIWCLRKSGSLQNGPTQGMTALTMLLVLTSSFFTGIIGVHPIFGAFLVGVICPHDGGFAVKMTEKIEDLISVLFLPLYFALSGLSTNLGLLNSGIAWAYVVGVLAVAFTGKIVGATLAARFFKLEWRESFTIGVLMSCKGLVELIVLNIGLQAKILTEQTFTIFVVMAVITTVATTPVTKFLYPPKYQLAIECWRRGETDKNGRPLGLMNSNSRNNSFASLNRNSIRRLMVHLRLDSLSSLFTLISLLKVDAPVSTATSKSLAKTKETPVFDFNIEPPAEPEIVPEHLEVHGLHLLELTERTSSVMQSTEGSDYGVCDPVVTAFTTFSRLNDIAAAGKVAIVPTTSFASTITHHAASVTSDLAIIPWSLHGSITEDHTTGISPSFIDVPRFQGRGYGDFVQQVLEKATCPVAVFLDRGFGDHQPVPTRLQISRVASAVSLHSRPGPVALPVKDKSHIVFFPFFGGADDRVGLRIVLQLAKKSTITLIIHHFSFSEDAALEQVQTTEDISNKFTEQMTAEDHVLLSSLQSTITTIGEGRITFSEIPVTKQNVIDTMLESVAKHVGQNPRNAGDLVVVGRTHVFIDDNVPEISNELKNTVGQAATAILSFNTNTSVMVTQVSRRST